ncbi:MAG: hypothetical protein GW886_04305 [Rhodobacterales bacterium]|nr:hypothetical protein [Rhodobacterales bacterium]NCT12769.1 hypothetical protein [Rhodobacterales bacterium]
MEWVMWGFGALMLIVAVIVGVAAWVAFRRDGHLPNSGVRMKRPTGGMARSDPRRGVPKSR